MSKASRDADDADSTTPRINRAPPAAVKPSPYYGLQDAPSPSGRLSDRIVRLRQRCIEALGRDAFTQAYQFLRDHEEVSEFIIMDNIIIHLFVLIVNFSTGSC